MGNTGSGDHILGIRGGLFALPCIVLVALLAAGCDEPAASTSLTRPSTPPASLLTFSGTLQPQGRQSYSFTVKQGGEVEVTLIAVGPTMTVTVGLGIGTVGTGGVCTETYAVQAQAGPMAQIIGTGQPGPLCVTIFDVGNLTEAVNYTMTIASS